jgi:putative RNA 2'-phosphotransferase
VELAGRGAHTNFSKRNGRNAMDDQRLVRVSKFLSKHLRHEPERIGLALEAGGWVRVGDLLDACARAGFPIGREELDEVVARNSKQRFSFDASGERIRANQGHSVAVDLQLEPQSPPETLYHGTGERSVPSIMSEGLQKRSRHHVHLSPDAATARAVGSRHGRPVVLEVAAGAMQRAGHTFFRSENGVWLADAVPPEFLKQVDG